jgi:nucleotide-binding universal stress UspA family protein
VSERIVVGVDASEPARDALRWAVEEGRLRGAEVIAVHAWEAPVAAPDLSPGAGIDVVEGFADAYELAVRFVTGMVDEVVGDELTPAVSALAVEGEPAAALIDAAQDAQLLVVGSKGETGLAEVLLGSVTEECVRHAPCSVLIHRRPR